MDDPQNQHRILIVLNALKQASNHLHTTTNPLCFFLFKTHSTLAIEAFLELEPKVQVLFSSNPSLRNISCPLSDLKTQIQDLHHNNHCNGLFCRQFKISKLARSLESEIQTCMNRIMIRDLVTTLQVNDVQEKVNALVAFEERLSQGFDLGFQDLVLRAKVFPILEQTLLLGSNNRVKEQAAIAIEALVKFNKNVFVGLVLMGSTTKSLVEMTSSTSIRVLTSLVSFIRTPLVDEILCGGEIPRIVSFFRTPDFAVRAAALECVLEIAYIGRMEVIEAMVEEDLIKILMELQRSDFGGCVWRFGVEVEVGEGLSSEEKREIKLVILRLVKECSISEAEAASVCAEILWGSWP